MSTGAGAGLSPDLTVTQLFTLGAHGLVLLQFALATGSVATVAALALKTGLSRRMLIYAYEVGLLALYGHFLFVGPPDVSASLWNMLYWAALLGTAPLNMAPMLLEWRHLRVLYPRRKPMNFTCGLLCALVSSMIMSSLLAWVLVVFLQASEGLAT